MKTVSIDLREIAALERELVAFTKAAFPIAARQTVNDTAFAGKKIWGEMIRANMITRNAYTAGASIRVERSKTLDVDKQFAILGSLAEYMDEQEFGGTRHKKGREGIPIATSFSSGEGRAKPRRRLPVKSNKLQNIVLRRRRKKGRDRKHKNFLAVKEAQQSKQKYVFLDLGKTQGIFKVGGSKKRPVVRMVWDMSRAIVRTPKNPTLEPTTRAAADLMPGFYLKNLNYQVNRLNLFQGGR